MKRVRIVAVGKLRDAALAEACDHYFRRCRRRFAVEVQEVRDLRELRRALPRRGAVVALDERGEQHTSRQFAARLRGWLEQPEPEVVFLIGGADGLGPALRQQATHLWALGKLTFAHRLVRLLLAEQLYRAASILDGAPYHRD